MEALEVFGKKVLPHIRDVGKPSDAARSPGARPHVVPESHSPDGHDDQSSSGEFSLGEIR
jgi:hypothetical protein